MANYSVEQQPGKPTLEDGNASLFFLLLITAAPWSLHDGIRTVQSLSNTPRNTSNQTAS